MKLRSNEPLSPDVDVDPKARGGYGGPVTDISARLPPVNEATVKSGSCAYALHVNSPWVSIRDADADPDADTDADADADVDMLGVAEVE